jgi:zinc protease
MKRFCNPRGRLALAAALAALVFLAPAAAPALQAAPPKKVVAIEGITEYRLANGLRVLLYPDPSSSRVTVNMTVLVGSRHEGYGETGMAHLLEHMLFKGTPTHPDVPKALRDHGANFNGTTWVDRTNYFETMPASDANLEFAIKLEADRLIHSLIRREDLASEMTVVRNEFENGENNPVGILSQRMTAAAYEWHNYGKSTIGNRSDIERVPVDRLRVFYRKFYQPDNVVLVIAGRFDEKKALGYVSEYFGGLKKPARRLETTYTEEPPQDGERQVVLRRVGSVGTVGAVYHVPAAAHPDFAACEVLANLLDYEPGGRLYKALVLTKKATKVGSFASGYHDPGLIEVIVQTDRKDEAAIRALRTDMLDVLESLQKEPFAKDEVERVKRKLLKQRELLMTDANRIGVTLSEWASKGDWRLFFLHRDRLEKVTPADVARVAQTYLKRSNRTAGLFLPTDKPQRSPVPEAPLVADLVKDYKGKAAVAAGEVFDPTPENIENRVKRLKLPSGIKAALLPKKSRGQNVVFRLTLRFGNADSLKGNGVAADFLGTLMRRGTRDMTRQQLDDAFDQLKARVSVSSSAGSLTVTVQCKRDNLPKVLELVAKVLREPSFPAEEFDVLKRQTLDQLEMTRTEPQPLAVRAIRRKINPYGKDEVHYVATLDEELALTKATTLERVKQLYAEQLGGQHGELAVVGEFDPDAVTKAVGDALKDWKAKTAYRRVPRRAFPEVKGERVVINTPDKENAVYVAAESLALKDSDPDYPALLAGNYLLGAAPLASRLSNRVRGKEGLSYGVGSQVSASDLDPAGMFLIFAIYNPVNFAKVDKAIAEEVDKFYKEGVQPKELVAGVKGLLQARKNGRSTDAALAGQLASGLASGRTFAYVAELEKKMTDLTPEAVQSAFRRRIDPKRLVTVRAGDFSKKEAPMK